MSPALRIDDAQWETHGNDVHSAMHENKIERRYKERITDGNYSRI